MLHATETRILQSTGTVGQLPVYAEFTLYDLVVVQKGKIERETVYQLVTNLQRQKSLQKEFQTKLGITEISNSK